MRIWPWRKPQPPSQQQPKLKPSDLLFRELVNRDDFQTWFKEYIDKQVTPEVLITVDPADPQMVRLQERMKFCQELRRIAYENFLKNQ